MIKNMNKFCYLTLIGYCGIVLFFPLSSIFAAGTYTQVGRYLTAPNKPLSAQTNLLRQTLQVHFPENVQTLGQAMNYILKFSSYKLVDRKAMSGSVRNMLNFELPLIDRNFGPMTLEKALQTLAGKPYRLLVDRVHRLISFQLKPSYRS